MDSVVQEHQAEAYVHGICFKTGPPRRTGVELEWLVHDSRDPRRPVPAERLDAVLAPLERLDGLPRGGRVTREPGGQVELSSLPALSPADCIEATAADLAALRERLAEDGLALGDSALAAHPTPRRVLDGPRYRAMETYFDRHGPWGRVMMRATAAVQVSVDAGDDSGGPSGFRSRWRLAHRLGPVFVAAFANSPLWRGRPSGWVSTRQAVWARMDPGRTRPVGGTAHARAARNGDGGGSHADPRVAFSRYALDARLLCLRRSPPAPWTAPGDLPLRSWLRGAPGARGERPPTLADVAYHLTTLFPPVRPRGWLELRMIDAQQGDDWVVPVLLAAALLDDPVAADAAWAATEPLAGGGDGAPGWEVWLRAAGAGPADRRIGTAVRACFAVALDALDRGGAAPPLRRAVAGFADRYALRGRCPADDRLDALRGSQS